MSTKTSTNKKVYMCRHECRCIVKKRHGKARTQWSAGTPGAQSKHEASAALHPDCTAACTSHTKLEAAVKEEEEEEEEEGDKGEKGVKKLKQDNTAAPTDATHNTPYPTPLTTTPHLPPNTPQRTEENNMGFPSLHIKELPRLIKANNHMDDAIFTQHQEVQDVLANHPVAVFVVHPQQEPYHSKLHHRPPNIDELFTHQLSVTNAALVPVNIPNMDEDETTAHFADIYKPDRQRRTETEMWEILSGDGGGVTKWANYIPDVEEVRVWGNTGEEQTIMHFLNSDRFSGDKSSLFRILVDKKITAKGITLTSYYLKTSTSIYRVHREQCYFTFFNYCFYGRSIWYFVMHDDESIRLFDDYIIKRVCDAWGIDSNGLKTAERDLFPLLMCTKAFMFNPVEVQQAGVKVYRHVQQAGEVLMGSGRCAHWGAGKGEKYCVQMAINTCEVSWLEHTPPHLLVHLRLVRKYFAAQSDIKKNPNTTLHARLYDPEVRRMILHHTPYMGLLFHLLGGIREDLNKPAKEQTCRHLYSKLLHIPNTLTLIDEALGILEDPQFADAK